jgi:hypothetical protein
VLTGLVILLNRPQKPPPVLLSAFLHAHRKDTP